MFAVQRYQVLVAVKGKINVRHKEIYVVNKIFKSIISSLSYLKQRNYLFDYISQNNFIFCADNGSNYSFKKCIYTFLLEII